jgi:murein DD-endopeptidase MepM/ murein hydrolase activator NlpD
VKIAHGVGITTVYGHIRSGTVTEGQAVHVSQLVTDRGNKGESDSRADARTKDHTQVCVLSLLTRLLVPGRGNSRAPFRPASTLPLRRQRHNAPACHTPWL